MINKVRELLEGVKISDHPPGMEGHLNLMRGIFAGDRYSKEAVSKLVTAIVLGYDTSDIGGNPLGYAALRAIQDEIRASEEYKYFLAAVNDSFGGHAPLQQNGTFDALQRHIEARGAANMEDRKRDLATNATSSRRNIWSTGSGSPLGSRPITCSGTGTSSMRRPGTSSPPRSPTAST